jgi:flagellar motor switch protein FliG
MAVEKIEEKKLPLEGMSKKQRLAAFLVVLGPEVASSVLTQFDEREVEEISTEMVSMKIIPLEQQRELIKEFMGVTIEASTSATGGSSFAKQVLERSLGSYKASEIIKRVAPATSNRTVDTSILRNILPRQLVGLLRKEQTQTWALVLSLLEAQRCSEVLALINPEMRLDIVERIATMEPTSSEVIEQVLSQIKRQLNMGDQVEVTSSGGTQILANILNTLDDNVSKQVLSGLEERNPELSRQIKKLLFVFEDIADLDKATITKVLREIDFHILAVALKTASEHLRSIIFAALSKRASEMIDEEIRFMPPVRLKEVEEAQEQIIDQLRRLEASGEVVLSKSGGGDALV